LFERIYENVDVQVNREVIFCSAFSISRPASWPSSSPSPSPSPGLARCANKLLADED
jgi:hypothetical protein